MEFTLDLEDNTFFSNNAYNYKININNFQMMNIYWNIKKIKDESQVLTMKLKSPVMEGKKKQMQNA